MKTLIIGTMLLVTTIVSAEEFDPAAYLAKQPYVDDVQFITIDDVNREADAWATCSAAYEIMAALLEESEPIISQNLKNMSNGAHMAVTMTHVYDGMQSNPDMEQAGFNVLWTMSKVLGESIPETKVIALLTDANHSPKIFPHKLAATIVICNKNSEGQQMYIDLWRILAKSGLLEFRE